MEVSDQQARNFVLAGMKVLKLSTSIHPDFKSPNHAIAIQRIPQGFKLDVNFSALRLQGIDWKRSIAQELIHMKQILDKRLRVEASQIFWENTDCTDAAFEAYTLKTTAPNYDMWKMLPWEAEALSQRDSVVKAIEEAMNVNTY